MTLVLVVDDEADLVTTCARLLRRQGYSVTHAGTRAQAISALAVRPDLVVADLRLPDGDGLDVVRAARRLSSPPPVIVVTGYPSEATRRQAMEVGAAAFLAKPFSLAAFVELVQKLLAPSPPPGPGPSPSAGLGWSASP
jgi:two-component system repressor protein LuxO